MFDSFIYYILVNIRVVVLTDEPKQRYQQWEIREVFLR